MPFPNGLVLRSTLRHTRISIRLVTGTESNFVLVPPDEIGVIKSKALPGLWFSTNHARDRDWWTLIDLVERGVTRLGHHVFMETIIHEGGQKEKSGDWIPFAAG
ncbi:hypothetical protein [Mariniblastus fucicola]|uniref:hypothetical protein n=1 Tax=Mariniblastus fucicola TaxID=980251 RepID=UPI0011DFC28E|nr:hypothetical protein [Mariniblastus fucicola]